ncbi:MAG: DUF4157 domain-containing protein [Rivularia sp. ALOHA_DT_140]|nr:DUF4157 domain-containing protein [Rivularia sp. ALOHA_DT_140]
MPKRKNSNQSSSSSQTLSVQIPKNGGSLLSQNTRTFFETRFNHDFSQVRIHTGSQSAKAAQQINANAFTVGSNIYFNKAQYDTSSLEGMKLLAHELTHVIQQDDNLTLRRNICRSGNCPQGQGTEVINEDCRRHTPSGRFISRLDVVRNSSLSQVYATWSDGTRQGPWNATTHPSNTPLRPESSADRVGLQCSIRHTNPLLSL